MKRMFARWVLAGVGFALLLAALLIVLADISGYPTTTGLSWPDGPAYTR